MMWLLLQPGSNNVYVHAIGGNILIMQSDVFALFKLLQTVVATVETAIGDMI